MKLETKWNEANAFNMPYALIDWLNLSTAAKIHSKLGPCAGYCTVAYRKKKRNNSDGGCNGNN
jgi:hypothetical protein